MENNLEKLSAHYFFEINCQTLEQFESDKIFMFENK